MPIMPVVAPIIQPKPDAAVPAPPTTVPVTPQITDPTYDGVAVDTQYTPRGSLLTYAEGSNWTVTYYRQLVGNSNELSTQQMARPGAFQQYQRIKNVLLKVTAPLSTSQDNESKSMILTGTALSMNGLIPNVGDQFVADAGDGKAAIFVVTNSDKRSLLKDSLFQIEYLLKDYATSPLLADMDAKVVSDATYIAGNLMIGRNPIIATDDMVQMQSLATQLRLLIAQYFANFFSVDYQTLLVPDQVSSTYDTFLTHAILNYIGTEDNLVVPRIRLWNVDGDLALKVKTLWDALNVMRYDYLPMCNQHMGVTGTSVLNDWPYFQSAYYSGMSQLVYPIDGRTDVDSQYGLVEQPALAAFAEGKPVNKDISRLITKTDLTGLSYTATNSNGLPDILPVAVDDYYVFSKNFYTPGLTAGSCLENITLQALKGATIDLGELLRLATNASSWGNLERFYYVPVIIALIKANIGNV